MLAAANWATAYGFQLLSSQPEGIKFWVAIQYLSIATIPVIWIIFCLKLTGRDKWLRARHVLLLFAVPLLTLFLHISNEYHHFYYSDVSFIRNGPLAQMKIEPGPWYKIHTLFFYGLLAWGLVLLVSSLKSAGKPYRKQYAAIIFAALLPWIANLAFMLGFRPFNIDLTSYIFVATALLIAFNLQKLKVMDIIPMGFSAAAVQMSDGLVILNKDNLVSHINKAAGTLLCAKQIVMGEELNEGFVSSELARAIRTKNQARVDITLVQHTQTYIYEAQITPLYSNGTFNGTLILIRDITAEKDAEAKLISQAHELQELNLLKDKLFNVIAHDLRSPFAGIKSWLELADEGIIEKEEFWEFIPQLLKQVNDVSELLDNLFSWSRMQIAGQETKPEEIELGEFTQATCETFKSRAEAKGISLEYEIEAELNVWFDRGALHLIFRNIISNAIKFCSTGDIIRIIAERVDNSVLISFIDSGVGIPEKIQSQLFKSVGTTTPGTHMEKGSGFGLAICYEYALKNCGLLSVRSEEGTGSVFSLDVPVQGREDADIVAVENVLT